ncbi:sigma factor-like helix-turn-helix DNA-binding protein [Sciscionella sediminilitoris]|uniref:sigma factor-like helix-turn-helix DNA-binding protein n=1 Tax=Sciscionella sediminilitoris TaxID=1445613 RepID=UPI00068FE43D|nr:sigma factor-like helix-turn-helix DNA-binding protein [Sciscionella sp. SE31]
MTEETAEVRRLLERTGPRVWRVCAALVDPDSAEELAARTYYLAIRSGSAAADTPLSWLAGIARGVCAEERARRGTGPRAAEAGRHPATLLRGALAEAVDRLAVEPREALLLTAVAGLPVTEAASACGCSVEVLRDRVAYARTALADDLGIGTASRREDAAGDMRAC